MNPWRSTLAVALGLMLGGVTGSLIIPLHRIGIRPHVDDAWVIASSQLGSFPFGDGWGGSFLRDRMLPPAHIWISRMLGGGWEMSQLASWLEGVFACAVLALWIARRNPVHLSVLGCVLLLTWETQAAQHLWAQPWWNFAAIARYDMMGLLMTAASVMALDGASESDRRWGGAGIVAGLALLAHVTAIPTLIASTVWIGCFHHQRILSYLSGVFIGSVPLGIWLMTAGHASPQIAAQLDRGNMILPGLISEWDRWSFVVERPTIGSVALALVPIVSAVLNPRRPAGLVTLFAWLATSILDGTSGGNYALIYLPVIIVALIDLLDVFSSKRFVYLIMFSILISGTWELWNRQKTLEPLPKSQVRPLLSARLPADARLLIDLRYWPYLMDKPSVTPFFVMQWERRPEDHQTLSERLTSWCPTHVVRSPGDWPFEIVKEGWGGPSLQHWLDEHVSVWTYAGLPYPLNHVQIGIVDRGLCSAPPMK